MEKISRIFVVGMPGLYGGAATELHDQILIWLALGIAVNIIPISNAGRSEPLYQEMVARGVTILRRGDWRAIQEGDPVIAFCLGDYFRFLPMIRRRTRRTVFVNCMTWISGSEVRAMSSGQIAMFLYQNPAVMKTNAAFLRSYNADPDIRFRSFQPYFNAERFSFHYQRLEDVFCCGRISRQDPDKYAANTLEIYEKVTSPRPKRGIFLGFDARSEAKTGKPPAWIRTAIDQRELSQAAFYEQCDIVLQPTDTMENWPRIGLEAMASGSVLIVDNRGGWKTMLEHGKTGWLCDGEEDFVRYASLMAHEPNLRDEVALAARERGRELSSLESSMESWKQVFEELAELPP